MGPVPTEPILTVPPLLSLSEPETEMVTVTPVLMAWRLCDLPAFTVIGFPSGLPLPGSLVAKLKVIPSGCRTSAAPTKVIAPPLGMHESAMLKSPFPSTVMVSGAQPTEMLFAGVVLMESPEI